MGLMERLERAKMAKVASEKDVSLEELEKIEKATREKEKAETQYYLRATLIFLTVTAILALILWWIL